MLQKPNVKCYAYTEHEDPAVDIPHLQIWTKKDLHPGNELFLADSDNDPDEEEAEEEAEEEEAPATEKPSSKQRNSPFSLTSPLCCSLYDLPVNGAGAKPKRTDNAAAAPKPQSVLAMLSTFYLTLGVTSPPPPLSQRGPELVSRMTPTTPTIPPAAMAATKATSPRHLALPA